MPAPTSFLNIARTAAAIGLLAAPLTSLAQTTAGDAETIALLREQVAALTRRLDEVERRQASLKSGGAAVQNVVKEAQVATKQAQAAAAEATAAQKMLRTAATGAIAPVMTVGTIEGLAPYEEMGSQSGTEDALRSDLPGIALRIPNSKTEAQGRQKSPWRAST